jgi:methylenetetrahydrofolate reductase (NADPH)
MESDLNNLKIKQEAGASFFITQMFFDNDAFYAFREKLEKKGITLPIHAGIMPITSAKQLGTTVSLSGSSIPKALADLFAKYADNPEDMRSAGIDYAVKQIRDLKANGVEDVHIYTMNKPKMAKEIIDGIID